MSAGGLNLLVFREGRRCVSGRGLKDGLLNEIAALPGRSHDSLLRALLRAGELECAAADAGVAAILLERATDHLAEALVGVRAAPDRDSVTNRIRASSVPDEVSVSAPEGFAYYGLHPLAYANVLNGDLASSNHVVVVGIRSIGTTLSAVTAAAARKQGKSACRITVRPQGHPYNRQTQLSDEQQEFIKRQLGFNADFLVVDEGPGLSGSSFLSVADALLATGVPRGRMTLICGHKPDFESFCCADGPARGRQFRWVAAPSTARKPDGAEVYVGGGEWRGALLPDEASWPASWTTFERTKYLTAPGSPEPRLFKFAGFGHYGDPVREREAVVSESRFGPLPQSEADGFVSYPRLAGRPMSACDLNESAVLRLAEYCAFRARHFKAQLSDLHPLQQMAEHNLAQMNIDVPLHLGLERPVLADARMQPHEWLILPDGKMMKTDSGSHGDDHFFPGPADIAWDLAGAIVEWQMDEAQSEALLSRYQRISGDDAKQRIHDFIVAYSAFRTGYCLMAANALRGTPESKRMGRAAEFYREQLARSGHAVA